MASLKCCKCCRSNAVSDSSGDAPKVSISKAPTKSRENECTEVDIDESAEPLGEVDGPWSINSLFRSLFHAAPDNKVALKLYGSKNGIMKERIRQEKCKSGSRWMIHPYSHFRWYWDITTVLLLLFTIIVLPVSIAFYSQDQTKPEWLSINIMIDSLFMIDVIINFRTGITTSTSPDMVILEPKKVALKYVRGWFFIDFLSSFPFDYFTLIVTEGQVSSSLLKASRALRFIRLAKLFSLLKLLRISRLLRFMQKWEDLFDLAGGMLRITKLILLMLLLAHWNGCIQFLIPELQGVPHNSWIALNHLQNASIPEKYSWSLFKAISHMLCIGFGRWPPQNVTEVWLTIVSMMVGATFYALFIGNMSTLLLSIDSSGRLYNEKLNQVEEYMRYRKIPQHLRTRVQEFYEYRFRRKYFNEEAILQELSQGLREDIVSHNCQELVRTVPFLQNASSHFVTAVLTKLRFEVFLEGEHIMHAGAKGDKMYFIRTGVVDVINEETGTITTSLSDGSHFGEICLLTDDRRVATIVCKTTCDLFSLSKKHFEELLIEYPEMRCALETVALNRLSKLGSKNMNPPLSEMMRKGHISTTIPPPHMSHISREETDFGYQAKDDHDGKFNPPTEMKQGVCSTLLHTTREESSEVDETDFGYQAKDDYDGNFNANPPTEIKQRGRTLPPLRIIREANTEAQHDPYSDNTNTTHRPNDEIEFHFNHDCD